MLTIVEYGKDEYAFPSLLVLGCFDAIHLGHRELFKKAKLQAKINGLDLGVMMFRDGKGGKQIYSFEERISFLERFNVKFVLVIDFTDEFKTTAPLDFLHTIEDKLNVKAYMSGKDFRFGKGAKGKSSTLKNYADDEENGVWYMPVKDVTYEGEKISTTLIKSCLESGDINKANILLGENFFVEGEVVSGVGRGEKLGYPTINICYPEWKFPIKQGVYKVKSEIDGVEYFGIANYGNCPTFDDSRIALEVNFEGFSGDLYGKTLKVTFLKYIRDIVKFSGAEELSAQLASDKASLALSDEEFDACYPLTNVGQPAEEQVAAEEKVENCSQESAQEQQVVEDNQSAASEQTEEVQASEEQVSTEENAAEPTTEDNNSQSEEESAPAEEISQPEEENIPSDEVSQAEEEKEETHD
ncbi:MAG: riboflavin biosynthesis protein RibF [Candidatus Coproplasma sp.]